MRSKRLLLFVGVIDEESSVCKESRKAFSKSNALLSSAAAGGGAAAGVADLKEKCGADDVVPPVATLPKLNLGAALGAKESRVENGFAAVAPALRSPSGRWGGRLALTRRRPRHKHATGTSYR